MNFPSATTITAAKRAALAVNNNMEQAIDWYFNHQQDADLDAPLPSGGGNDDAADTGAKAAAHELEPLPTPAELAAEVLPMIAATDVDVPTTVDPALKGRHIQFSADSGDRCVDRLHHSAMSVDAASMCSCSTPCR